jgi:hypothetical protein
MLTLPPSTVAHRNRGERIRLPTRLSFTSTVRSLDYPQRFWTESLANPDVMATANARKFAFRCPTVHPASRRKSMALAQGSKQKIDTPRSCVRQAAREPSWLADGGGRLAENCRAARLRALHPSRTQPPYIYSHR